MEVVKQGSGIGRPTAHGMHLYQILFTKSQHLKRPYIGIVLNGCPFACGYALLQPGCYG